ncbi:hypothetical protein H2200_003320 [Cladophialophora chaetospira]|uniref:Fructose-bisphosphate aldolase n=1 Tax=Cladophialophora chaetospira TaxID=386627 RepID=A0AA38XH45_9EURO|nr:hypothetical protein H2200_003320 [Cladophialophora chaetospira]
MIAQRKGNPTLEILTAAARGSYGVLAVIVYNVEQLTALVRAAEAKRSPLIIQLFPSTLIQLPSLVFAVSAAAKIASVPISVHLDHAQDEAQIRQCIEESPFDSIMVDMSHYEKEENLSKTRELAKLCHANGIAVEAESGRINGDEDGIAGTGNLEGLEYSQTLLSYRNADDILELLTTAADVEDFIEVEIDMLAPSVGNIHGDYGARGPHLDMARLSSISHQLKGRAELVLHGTNDFEPELTKECIRAGVTKININKLILQCWNDHLAANAHKFSVTRLIDGGIAVLQPEIERWMDIVGSSGKA